MVPPGILPRASDATMSAEMDHSDASKLPDATDSISRDDDDGPGSDFTLTLNPFHSSPDEGAELGIEDETVQTAQKPPGTRRLGEFELLRELGRGGMGVVYEGRQLSLGKRVAVKLLSEAGGMDKKSVKRFQTEAWAAAQLQHRNIVPVYQLGCDRGIYFYVMQYIDGSNLSKLYRGLKRTANHRSSADQSHSFWPAIVRRFANRSSNSGRSAQLSTVVGSSRQRDAVNNRRDSNHRSSNAKQESLTSDQLIEAVEKHGSTSTPQFLSAITKLCIDVADALHYAHEMGIVHRDIKPSNLLLDSDGEVWVSDFGLAQVENETGLTATGGIVGTLRYMSPEQVLGRRVGIDHRTDIYSLGITLYELLTLKPAFTGENREIVMRKITFDDPIALRKHVERIPSALETIVMKAIAKNPADRYQTAEELADDLRRFRGDQPIQARKPTLPQRFGRWRSRNRTLVTSAGVVAAAIFMAAVAVAAISWKLYTLTATSLQAETVARTEIEGLYHRSEGLRLLANSFIKTEDDPSLALLLAVEAAKHLPGENANRAIMDAYDVGHEYRVLSGHQVSAGHVAFNSDGAKLISTAAKTRQVHAPEPAILWDIETGARIGELRDDHTITSAVFSPDRFRILTTSETDATTAGGDQQNATQDVGGTPALWDSLRYEKLLSFADAAVRRVEATAFDPLGRRVVLPSRREQSATVYDCVAGHAVVNLIGHDKEVVSAAFSPQGERIVTVSVDNTVRIWEAESGKQIYAFTLWRDRFPDAQNCLINSASFSPNGLFLVTSSNKIGTDVWDLDQGQRVDHERIADGFAIPWPSAPQLLTYSRFGREVSMRDPMDGLPFRDFVQPGSFLDQALISPDGQYIATSTKSNLSEIFVWDATTGKPLMTCRGNQSAVNGFCFSPGSDLLATASSDNSIRLWKLESGEQRSLYPIRPRREQPIAVASPDGQRLAIASRDDRTVGRIASFGGSSQPISMERRIFLPNGSSTSFVAIQGNRLSLHSVDNGVESKAISNPNGRFLRAVINPAGDRVAACNTANLLILWMPDMDQQMILSKRPSNIFDIKFSPTGNHLAAADETHVRVWDAKSGTLLAELACDASAQNLAFSSDGNQLAVATDQNRAILWSLDTFEEQRQFHSPEADFDHVLFGFDGQHLIGYRSWNSRTVQVWDATTAQLESSFPLAGEVHIAMHPREREALISSSTEGAMIWQYDKNQREPVTDSPMLVGRFNTDGTQFLIASGPTLTGIAGSLPTEIAPAPDYGIQRRQRSDLSLVDKISLTERVFELFVSDDGSAFFNASHLVELAIHDVDSHAILHRLHGHAAKINGYRFTKDSKTVVTFASDSKIGVWDVENGKLRHWLVEEKASPVCIALGNDSRLLVAGTSDGRCIFWDLESGMRLSQAQVLDSPIVRVELDQSGDRLLVIASDHQIRLVDVKQRQPIPLKFGTEAVRWAEFSDDGTKLLVLPAESPAAESPTPNSEDKSIESPLQNLFIVPIDGGNVTKMTHRSAIVTSHFAQDEDHIVTALENGEVIVQKTTSADVELRLPHPETRVTGAVHSSTGDYIAVGCGERTVVWKTKPLLRWFSFPSVNQNSQIDYDFNPFLLQRAEVLGASRDGSKLRVLPLEQETFAKTVLPRELTNKEKSEFLLE